VIDCHHSEYMGCLGEANHMMPTRSADGSVLLLTQVPFQVNSDLKRPQKTTKSHFPKICPAAHPPQPPHWMVLPNSAITKQAKHYNYQALHLHCSPHPVLLDLFLTLPWTVARRALLGCNL